VIGDPLLGAGASLAVGLLVTLLLMGGIWFASLRHRDASLVDRFWGAGFVLLAWVYWLLGGAPVVGLAMVGAVSVWGLRLSVFLTRRNWGHGEDARYAAMRERHGARFALVSLYSVFLLQGVLLWLIAMPVFAGARVPGDVVLPALLLGGAVWLFGLLWESVADAQLAAFRRDPQNRGQVLDRGLWRYSRHPNYFGECVVWIGFFIMAAAVGGWWSGFSTALMILLLIKVSGVSLLEEGLRARKPAYQAYVRRTNALIPGPPRS